MSSNKTHPIFDGPPTIEVVCQHCHDRQFLQPSRTATTLMLKCPSCEKYTVVKLKLCHKGLYSLLQLNISAFDYVEKITLHDTEIKEAT